ncbi:MAG: hypothetical protein C0169_00305 [Thermodesulfobacterium geofontis]|uniref:Uncharacterized protein n=1 Tax=Thermodesulfobacterium geofontis TaxID=1295609 RepID=A0A2N7QGV6_9BACT|nr:MAG: hypothetical protein C0169_00305 [Thermodesulfobacterium geofontis]
MLVYFDKDKKLKLRIANYNPFEFTSFEKLSGLVIHKSFKDKKYSVLETIWLDVIKPQEPFLIYYDEKKLFFYDVSEVIKEETFLNLYLLIDPHTHLYITRTSSIYPYLSIFYRDFLSKFYACIITDRYKKKIYGRAFLWKENRNFLLDLSPWGIKRFFTVGYMDKFYLLDTEKFYYMEEKNVEEDKELFSSFLQSIDIKHKERY